MEMHRIALAAISPSTTNPRKTFDQTKLDELAESIRAHGVLQPILLRPNGAPDRYEIVAGERRFRAAQAAGLPEIPATIRDLTDAQALELQVIENLQRDDLHELEEAEGYERLMQCTHDDGTTYSAEEIAGKVGKSKAYIYARLKLTDLCEAGREALRGGRIPASTALLIARIPAASLQEQCLGEILEGDWRSSGDAMSFREAKEHIEGRYMLRLKEAPFKTDDEHLVVTAGACGTCQKRTGNQPELFSDVANADVCTDPDCFAAKREAHVEVQRAKAKDSGKPVISGKAAKKLWPWEHSDPKGYVKLDDRCPGDAKGRHWRQVLGKAAAEHTLLERPSKPGTFVAVMPVDAVRALVEEKGIKLADGDRLALLPADREAAVAQREKDEAKRELEAEVRMRKYLALRDHVGKQGLGADALRAMIVELLDTGNNYDMAAPVLRLWGFTDEQIKGNDIDLESKAAKAESKDLLQMLLDVTFTRITWNEDGWGDLLKARGIDVKAIEREVKAEAREQAAGEPGPAKGKKKKGLAALGVE